MHLTPASIARVVRIPAGQESLQGELTLPAGATGIVVFALALRAEHVSRRRHIGRTLQRAGLGTLVLEPAAGLAGWRRREHIAFAADRLVHATAWINDHAALGGLRVGYFGAAASSPATLVAAAKVGHLASSVAICGGRPAAAGLHLPGVTAPTLFVVAGADPSLVAASETAYDRLHCAKRLVVVPGATQAFDEPGALDEAATLATDWFLRHLEAGVHA